MNSVRSHNLSFNQRITPSGYKDIELENLSMWRRSKLIFHQIFLEKMGGA